MKKQFVIADPDLCRVEPKRTPVVSARGVGLENGR
jgi:hypothetical protein